MPSRVLIRPIVLCVILEPVFFLHQGLFRALSSKIVIAAWHLENFNVGIGRYARELIEALGRVDQTNQYEILIPHCEHPFTARPNMRFRLIRFPLFRRRFWEQVAPLLVGPYDVLHFPYDSCVAWKRGKFVATIHDVKSSI